MELFRYHSQGPISHLDNMSLHGRMYLFQIWIYSFPLQLQDLFQTCNFSKIEARENLFSNLSWVMTSVWVQ